MSRRDRLTRRDFLRLSGTAAIASLVAACAPTPQAVGREAAAPEAVEEAPEAKKAWELIDWNKPVPMTDRLLADEYILPEGWDKATEGVKELVFFNSGALKDDIATAIGMRLFEQKTGIKMKALEVGGAYTFPKFLSVVTSKDPSVHFGFIRAEVEYAHVASAGWAHQIDEMWPSDVQALYSPGLVDALRWDDHFYGSVNIVQYYVFFYRPSWLEAAGVEKVPETWEEVYEAAKKTRAWAKENLGEDYYGIVFGASKSGHIHIAYLSALTYSQGQTLLKDGKWNLDTPEFRNAWNYLVGLMKDDVADVACLGYGWKDYHTVFGMGKAAMALAYSVYAVKFDEDFPELKGDWAAVPPPKWDASQPDSNRIGYINFDVYMINNFADEQHKAAAMLFLDFYRSKEAGMYELLVEGNDSFLPAVYEDPDIVEKVNWDFAKEVAKEIGAAEPVKRGITIPEVRAASARTARIEALPPGAAYVSDILSEYLGKAVLEGMDSNAAFDEALAKIREYTL
ncbi:MAG: extracellular solute-binding protein [Chloroflexi bacterium]|nr:extracellular solute-binding protein [Chloroflexota bacterium]